MSAKIWNGLLGESFCKDFKTYWENNFFKGDICCSRYSQTGQSKPASTFQVHALAKTPGGFTPCPHALLMQRGMQAVQLVCTQATKLL